MSLLGVQRKARATQQLHRHIHTHLCSLISQPLIFSLTSAEHGRRVVQLLLQVVLLLHDL